MMSARAACSRPAAQHRWDLVDAATAAAAAAAMEDLGRFVDAATAAAMEDLGRCRCSLGTIQMPLLGSLHGPQGPLEGAHRVLEVLELLARVPLVER